MVTLDWDNTNRLEARRFDDGTSELRIEYDYNDRDELEEIRRYDDAAGTTLVAKTGYGYDFGGRLTSIHHKDDSNATINHIQYQYDAANRLTQETSTLDPTRDYAHDAVGQLLSDGADNYSYDLNGNRTMSGYQTGTGNRLESDGTWNFVYNDEGNMTQKENIASGQLWKYSFDHNNRLTKVERQNSSVDPVDLRVEFKYDVLGNRIEKSVDADGDGVGTATVEKLAYDLHGNAWADLNSVGSLTTRRLYQDAVDAVFARIGASGNEDWYLTDHLGTIRDVLDYTGTTISHRRWDSYGNLVSETGTGSDRYGWTGREVDVETDLQYNRARYYDANIGRWISQDPIGFDAGDGNLYRYVKNGPANNADPSGLYEQDVHFFMTYYLAVHVGLDRFAIKLDKFHLDLAWIVAWSAEYTDHNLMTSPVTSLHKGYLQSIRHRELYKDVLLKYHFRYVELGAGGAWVNGVKKGSKESLQPYNAGLAAMNPFLIGIGLHAYQDSWSHHGYGAGVGHKDEPFKGHAPDYPWFKPDDAMAMAEQTYNKLKEYSRRLGTKEAAMTPWKTLEKKIRPLLRERVSGAADRGDFAGETASRIERWKELFRKERLLDTTFDAKSKHILKQGGQARFEAAAKKVGLPDVP